MFYTDPSKLGFCRSSNRSWQGIPGIERTAGGRLFVTFYSGGKTEQLGNYCVLLKSDDGGSVWSEPIAAAYCGENFRCYDPCLWVDPLERLWFIWAKAPQQAVYASVCVNPDSDTLVWSEPRLIGHDVMMNKPIVAADGSWLFPMAVWRDGVVAVRCERREDDKRLSFVYRSTDNGETFERIGGADVPDRCFDEHMLLELKDGRLMMLVRTLYGIGVSYSDDGGVTWTPGEDSGLGGPNSRFHIRRLPSGKILLVNHFNFKGRNNLTAMLSSDECKTWEGFLTLDPRDSVSYPDSALGDGYIYIVYDRERGAAYSKTIDPNAQAKEILFAKVTEEDILAGRLVSEGSALRLVASSLSARRT